MLAWWQVAVGVVAGVDVCGWDVVVCVVAGSVRGGSAGRLRLEIACGASND